MTWDRVQLRRWARPEGILLPEEISRLPDFLDLFTEQLRVTGAGLEPTIVQLFEARRVAEIVWEFDRTTSSKEVVKERRASGSRALASGHQFTENQIRHRLNNLALEEIDSARQFCKVAAGAVEVHVGVIPLDERRRKAR